MGIQLNGITGDITTPGDVGIGGTLTYEDVANVDSVGLITARSGINVSGGEVKVGTAVTVSSGGVITSGIVTATNVSAASSVTATTFHGSGANLTGISAGTSLSGSTNNTVCTVTGANAIQGEGNLKFDGTNLGVGVDPSGVSSYSTIHLKGQTSGNGGAIRLTDHGDTPDSDDFTIYKNSAAGYLRINGTDPLIAYLNGADRLHIDSNGDLGLGIAAVPQDSGARTLHIHDTTTGSAARAAIRLTHGSSGTAASNGAFIGFDNNPDFYLYNQENGKLRFGVNGAERMVIESAASGQLDGRVLVGPSVPTSGDDSQMIIRNNESAGIYRCLRLNNQSNNNRITMSFEGGGTATGDIRINGSTTSYNSYSDYRLKENVVPLTDAITKLKTLKPYRFNYIASPDITLDGFFAHEVSPAVAEAVGGEKDKVDTDGNVVPQALDMAKLVPLLTASLQEAITKIETLESKVATLEGS